MYLAVPLDDGPGMGALVQTYSLSLVPNIGKFFGLRDPEVYLRVLHFSATCSPNFVEPQ